MAVAQTDSASAPPHFVWQKPLPATLTVTSLSIGVSPFFSDYAFSHNLLIREHVQMWRRNSFDFRSFPIDNVIQFIPFVSVVGLNLAGVPSRHSTVPLLRRSLSSFLLTTAIVQSLKWSVNEIRPDYSNDNSFPSGHTAFAFSGAELLRLEYSETSPLIPVAGYAVATLTAFLRVYNDHHWCSDLFAGAAIGIIAADLSSYLNSLFE